jgi:hypothetical protein
LFPQRQSTPGVAALLPILGVLVASFGWLTDAYAKSSAKECADSANIAILSSPFSPSKAAPLRVVITAEKPLDAALTLTGPDGSVAIKSNERHGGPPYFWFAEVASPAVGTWHAKLTPAGTSTNCDPITQEIAVHTVASPPPRATGRSVWPIRNSWNRKTEDLYSAWIEKLFDAPLDEELSWPALHEVLRDKSRNVLGLPARLCRPPIFFARLLRV